MLKYTQKKLFKKVGSVGHLTSNSMLMTWTRLLSWSLQLDSNIAMRLSSRIIFLRNTNGDTFTVKYLKECVRLLSHFIAGQPVHLSLDVPVALSNGIPKILPGYLRSRIRDGDPSMIRLSFSVLSVFRVIKIPGKLKLETIFSPFTGRKDTLEDFEIRQGLSDLFGKRVLKDFYNLNTARLVRSGSSGPNSPSSLRGLWLDVLAWHKSPDLKDTLFSFGNCIPGGIDLLNRIFSKVNLLEDCVDPLRKLYLGRLALKEEAAGKVRVFAITDLVTQSLMKPLSDRIFSYLKTLPTDGTFNQSAPLQRLSDIIIQDDFKEKVYSYDLSAATDRLPLAFQESCLRILCNAELGQFWRKVLTDRDWTLLKNKSSERYISEDLSLKYSVGQPMGALSSWAMLALSHHTIVRVAALRLGIPNFDHYALLGDDIVIANESVARSYHYIMTTTFGVEINLHKTLVSSNSFEFAKQIIRSGVNLSAIGPKNLLVSIKSTKGLLSLIVDMVNKGFEPDSQKLIDMFSSVPGTRRNPRLLERMLWSIIGPFGIYPSVRGLTSRYNITRSVSSHNTPELIELSDAIERVIFDDHFRRWAKNLSSLVLTSVRLMVELPHGFLKENWINSSLIYEDPISLEIRSLYDEDLSKILEEEPRWGSFDPGIFWWEVGMEYAASLYTEDFLSLVQRYINFRVNSHGYISVPSMDPWSRDSGILPNDDVPNPDLFWSQVYSIHKERTPENSLSLLERPTNP